MFRVAILLIAIVGAFAAAGSAPGRSHDTGAPANVFVSPSGSDAGSGCVRSATATGSWPSAATACASIGKALSLAQPGDVVQLEPGTYGNLKISRQSGSDSPPVVVRGDPNMVDQFGCAGDKCALGNVIVRNLVVCGHGLSVDDLDSKATDQTYMYVGDSSCPGGASNAVTANHDIALHNDHFTQGTLRGTTVGMYHTRLGPEYDLCASPASRSDLLHIWPTGNGHEPVNVTVDHSVIYGNYMSTRGCGGAHADNIQVLGVAGLTFTNNIVGRAADDDWTDGQLNGTHESGTILIANNFFSGADTIRGSVGVQFGLDQDSGGGGACTAHYIIRNNTFATGNNVTLKCGSGSGVWTNNYLHMSTGLASTCRSGTFDSNRWDSSSGTTCGSHTATCTPTWLHPSANTSDTNFGWDLHLAPTDTCLLGRGQASFVDAASRPVADIDGDMRPLRAPVDVGADQREPASIVVGRSIGRVSLGMPKAAVEAFYGPGRITTRRIAGARSRAAVATYRVPGATLSVAYGADKRVIGVGTSGGYYTTGAGIGVASPATDAAHLAGARWVKCRSAYVAAVGRGAVTLFAARSQAAAVSGVTILLRSLAAPTSC
jgi:hypothetical protein